MSVNCNLVYGTVTDGGGTAGAFSSPANANDGTTSTTALRNDGVWGGGTYTSLLKSDLGRICTISSAVTYYGAVATDLMVRIDVSSDGSSWTDSGATYVEAAKVQTWTFPVPVSSRYWRLYGDFTNGGATYRNAIAITEWTLVGDVAGAGGEARRIMVIG